MIFYIYSTFSLISALILMVLFWGEFNKYLRNFIELGDGTNLIILSIVFLAIDFVLLLALVNRNLRSSLFVSQPKLLVYIVLSALILYLIIGVLSLTQLYFYGTG